MTKEERLAEIEKLSLSRADQWDDLSSASDIPYLINQLKNSWKREEIAVRALKFYANVSNWRSTHGNGGGIDDSIKEDAFDGWVAGGKARLALSEIEKIV